MPEAESFSVLTFKTPAFLEPNLVVVRAFVGRVFRVRSLPPTRKLSVEEPVLKPLVSIFSKNLSADVAKVFFAELAA